MALIDLSAIPQLEKLIQEAAGIRFALERIATCLEHALAIPEPPAYPEKPLGPEAVGAYATSIDALEGTDADELRERLRAAGLDNVQIEDELVSFLTGSDSEER